MNARLGAAVLVALIAPSCVSATLESRNRYREVSGEEVLVIGEDGLERSLEILGAPLVVRENGDGAVLAWGWARERFGTPEAFFERFFVWNYCPLVFLEESGKNRTPDKLPKAERTPLFEACDLAFRQMVECLAPRRIIGVGKFATDRARAILGESGPPISTVLHPSPASPIANRGWAPQAERQLEEMGIQLP